MRNLTASRAGPLLNAPPGRASGAARVGIHHGGGVGMGFSQPAGMVAVSDVMVCGGSAPALFCYIFFHERTCRMAMPVRKT